MADYVTLLNIPMARRMLSVYLMDADI